MLDTLDVDDGSDDVVLDGGVTDVDVGLMMDT